MQAYQAEQPGQQAPTGGAPGQQMAPTNAEIALGKGAQVGGAVASAGLGVAKLGVGKGMSAVKEMDPGQIGILIKVFNMATGLVLVFWAGVGMVLQIASFLDCDADTIDPTCCPSLWADTDLYPTGPPDGIKCTSPMSFVDNFSALIISLYMIPLGSILVLYELSTKRVGATESIAEPTGIWAKIAAFRESLMLYFGFIFFYKRRTQFLVFIGVLCMGNLPVDDTGASSGGILSAPIIGGILALLDAALHFAVRMQHPEFDTSMQAALSQADDANMAGMGGGGGGGSAPPPPAAYAPQQEDMYQAPAAPAAAPNMYAPAPAPAPMYAPAPAPANIYGDDGGTAI